MSDIERWVRDLESFRTRPAAKAELVRAGAAAVPALAECLRHPNESVRWVAARALGEIGDPQAEEPLREASKQAGMELVASDALDLLLRRGGAPGGASPRVQLGSEDPATTIRSALATPNVEVKDSREGLEMKVTLTNGRSQRVAAHLHMKDEDGREFVQFRTDCGPVRDDVLEWALRYNAKLPCAGIAVVETNPPQFIMLRNVYRDSLHAEEVVRVVMCLAQQGDALEKALVKEDKR